MSPALGKPPSERLILGLGVFSHDTSAALLRGSEVLFASEQERHDRIKHSRAFPLDSIAAALRHAGISFSDLDDVVINYDPTQLVLGYLRHVWRFLPGSLRMFFEPLRYINVWKSRGYKHAIRERFGDISHLRWHAVRHHLAHAASAFFRSPFEESAILTSDALGEFESVRFAIGKGNRIKTIRSIFYPHSLAAVYSAITDHLGFEIYSGEGKVMGLAGWGKDDPLRSLDNAIRLGSDGEMEVDLELFRYHVLPFVHHGWTSGRFAAQFGRRREMGEPLRDSHANLAHSLQNLSNKVTVHLCKALRHATGVPNLCYAGGSALNGYSNTRMLIDGGFGKLYVQPAANDAGTALGAALYLAHHTLGLPREPHEGSTFLGPAFSEAAIEVVLKESGVSYRRPADLASLVGKRLAAGKIIGWFQGRLEFGPRALGHRSILANPEVPGMQNRLNLEIKKREPFRPFAPIVPIEDADRFFEMPIASLPYMLFIVSVRSEWRARLPAITHVDGTTRVQTVTKHDEPLLWSLLRAFERESGIPVLVNTSFNGPGVPIVCSPDDALRSFRRLGLDDLVIGPFLVSGEI